MSSYWLSLWLAGALLFGFGTQALAQDGQPSQQLVHLEANGSITLTGSVTKPVYETVMKQYTVKVPYTEARTVEENGVTKQITVTVYKDETRTAAVTVCKHVCVAVCMPVDLKTTRGFEVDGRRIPIGDLTRRMTEGAIVVVSATDEMIPDYYASIYKPGTVILALPKTGMMMPPTMIPMPAPQFAPPANPVEAPRPPAARLEAPFAVQPVAFQPPAAPAPASATPVEERAPGPWDLLPKTPAPRIVFATRSGADQIKIRQFAEAPVWTEVTVFMSDESTAPGVMKKAEQLTRQSATVTLALNDVRFSSSDTKDIVAGRVKEKLGANEQTVLLSADGRPVDEFWLKNIKPSVLVLRGISLPPVSTAPAPPPMAYPAPMPAPAAPAPAPPAPPKT
jgi:hypothetical protein